MVVRVAAVEVVVIEIGIGIGGVVFVAADPGHVHAPPTHVAVVIENEVEVDRIIYLVGGEVNAVMVDE